MPERMCQSSSAVRQHVSKSLRALPRTGAGSGVGQVDKQALESCLGVCALALSVVMAGTGDLKTLKILRGASRKGLGRQAYIALYGNSHRGVVTR